MTSSSASLPPFKRQSHFHLCGWIEDFHRRVVLTHQGQHDTTDVRQNSLVLVPAAQPTIQADRFDGLFVRLPCGAPEQLREHRGNVLDLLGLGDIGEIEQIADADFHSPAQAPKLLTNGKRPSRTAMGIPLNR